jgi:hypothetical protein
VSGGKAEFLDREQQTARAVAIATLSGCALMIISLFGPQLVGLSSSDRDAEQLRDFHAHAGSLLIFAILSAIGVLLLIPGFVYLLRAARDRNPKVRKEMIYLVFLGFGVLAVSLVISWAARNEAANSFVNAMPRPKFPSHSANGLLDDSSLGQAAAGLILPAALGIIASGVYTGLQCTRAGLMTRFWGTFGMAVSVGVLFLGPIGVALWMIYVGLLIGNWLPRGRPPAWAAGEAIPWPRPGEAPTASAPERADGNGVVEGEAKPVPRQRGERRKRKQRREQ